MQKALETLLLACLLAVSQTAFAQESTNKYGIDDECYELFVRAESLFGQDGFTETNESLRLMALRKGDEKVLTNLLTNACKHTSSGSIRLGCSLEEVPGMIAFSVEDTGPGIPEGQAENIFKRFVKLDTSYTSGARFVLAIPVE